MFNQNQIDKAKKEVQEFLNKTTFNIEVDSLSQKDQTLFINLKTDEPQILIGEGGQTLSEIQHLLKAILKRKKISEELFYVDLDISDYKKKKIKYLEELARSVADDVSLTKKERILSSMPAYERRIIHLELAGRADVITESVGEEPERKIIIKPYP